MKKRIEFAFGKNVYLLGIDNHGDYRWLEAPFFDYGWYWGFGYVETYTNNKNPHKSKDIVCHTHIDTEFLSSDKKEIDILRHLEKATFTVDEGKLLNQYFTEFYSLKDQANKAHNVNEERYKELNETSIPEVMDKILQILNPEED